MIVRLVEGPDGGLVFKRTSTATTSPRPSGSKGKKSVSRSWADCKDPQGNRFRMALGLESLDNRGPRLSQLKTALDLVRPGAQGRRG